LIFVFDPLAVLLVIFASNIYNVNNENDEGGGAKEPEPIEPEPIEDIEELVEETDTNHQKVVDAINSADEDVVDFSYDFPEEKREEVIEYVEGENGNFEKSEEPTESLASLISGIDSNPVYIQLLDVLFMNGERGPGDVIPPYRALVKDISDKGIVCEDKVIKNFLTICNLLDITNMSNKDSVTITKNYSTAKGIISLVSK